MDNNSIIETHNLSKSYNKFVALKNVDFCVKKGRIMGLLGPNGAGKTTLIKVLTGLLRQYQGDVKIDGFDVGVESKKRVAYLPDSNYIDGQWTINYAMKFYKDFFEDFDELKAVSLFKIFDIDLDSKFKTLSKGNKEKVQLILTLSRRAKIYIFDEPIAGVDPAARELIFQLILRNVEPGASVIISTHLISDAEDILDDFVILKKGEIVRSGDVMEIRKSTGKTIDELFREDFRCLADF